MTQIDAKNSFKFMHMPGGVSAEVQAKWVCHKPYAVKVIKTKQKYPQCCQGSGTISQNMLQNLMFQLLGKTYTHRTSLAHPRAVMKTRLHCP